MSEYVRMSVGLRDLKKALAAKGLEVKGSISQDKQFANTIARVWADRVTKYVPRSAEPDTRHHLQAYQVSDGRVTWYRQSRTENAALDIAVGQEIASRLYMGPITGQFQSRYPGHMPRSQWDLMVRPGGPEWGDFVDEVKPLIEEWMRDNVDG